MTGKTKGEEEIISLANGRYIVDVFFCWMLMS